MLTHEHYEELCALAATAQASGAELVELKTHLDSCDDCRGTLSGFAQLVSQAIPEIADKRAPLPLPSGMTARFAARARSEGIALTTGQREVPFWQFGGQKMAWSGAAAAVLLTSFWISEAVHSRSHAFSQARIPSPVVVASHAVTTSTTPKAGLDREAVLGEQLQLLSAQNQSMASQLHVDELELKSLKGTKSQADSRVDSLSEFNAELTKRQEESAAKVRQLQQELEQVRSRLESDRVASLVQENELTNLRDTVSKQTAELSERHQLSAAANQAKDMIVARNLHIVDVHDADEDGKRQRAFGRIFYTEGKSLVFYAYDLAGPGKLDAKISFYLWGEKLGSSQRVEKLGIFRSDDQNDGRWVLTFEDPHILAQINSLFVTGESKKPVLSTPRGKKILFAFLGGQANHP